jgi:TolB-like protein
MPSILPGFEYDIFISYRQKDNKYDGWVTEFVANLKKELEATFKEDVSIYFDANPHDGLLETHQVSESLEGKLRCLIFIPIISQTYCDPKSFAWQHEFCAFNKRSREDQFGRDIKLANGNVASRILPVKIHDLDEEDKAVVEGELGGALRPIEFIFKSAGVNRPLRAIEERPFDNLNKTNYRDQINKVANSVKEIIGGLKKSGGKEIKAAVEDRPGPVPQTKKPGRRWMAVAAATVLLSMVGVYFFVLPNFTILKDPGSSGVAVLPFRNYTGDESLNYYGVGMASEIRTKLSMSKQFSFISSLQATLSYADTKKTPKEIGSELGVDYLLSGLYQKAGDKLKVEVELIDASTGRAVWSLPFESELADIFQVQASIAGKVLKQFSPKSEGQHMENVPTKNLDAFAHFTRGIELYQSPPVEGDNFRILYQPAIFQFEKAIQLDSMFVDAWAGLIEAECFVFINDENPSLEKKISKEVEYVNSHFPDSWQKKFIQGQYAYRVLHLYDKAIALFVEVLKDDPENLLVNTSLSGIYRRQLKFSLALRYAKKAVDLDPAHEFGWNNMVNVLHSMGDLGNSMKAAIKVWELSRKRSDAERVLNIAGQNNYPLDQLPDELKKDAGIAFTLAKLQVARNWKELKRISLKEKKYGAAAVAYWMLGKNDSARYWSQFALKTDDNNLKNYNTILRLKIISAPDLQHALAIIEESEGAYSEWVNDKEAVCDKIQWEIIAREFFGQYSQATEQLVKLNHDFPDYGRYGWLYEPWQDKIKKEYPPFREAVNKLKLKPVIDISKTIKL